MDINARCQAEQRATDLLHQTVERVEAARLRLARDLHDRLGQHLTLLHMEIGKLGPEVAQAAALGHIAEEIGQEARRLSLELRPTAIDDVGLAAALRDLVEGWGIRSGLATEVLINLPAKRLSLPLETTLYRVLQEALNNVVKHAEASRVAVTLEVAQAGLRMVVEDDGKGMSATRDPAAPPSFGLQGITERLALLGGTLEIESAPGGGTTLLMQVPM
jgi:signal transduction histidine kinase